MTAGLLQPTAMLLTGRCHITLSPVKSIRSCDAVFRQSSLFPLLLVLSAYSEKYTDCGMFGLLAITSARGVRRHRSIADD